MMSTPSPPLAAYFRGKVVSDASLPTAPPQKRYKREHAYDDLISVEPNANWNTLYNNSSNSSDLPRNNETTTATASDEGMYVFRSELNPILEKDSTAALYYNVGQSHIGRQQFGEAKQWFEMALNEIFSSILQTYHIMDDDTNVALIRIHHNCGYCCYQMGLMKEAMMAYEKALSVITTRLEQSHKRMLQFRNYQALTENCIAVLLFYMQPADDTAFSYNAMSLFLRNMSVLEGINGKTSQTILDHIGRLHFSDPNSIWTLEAYQRSLGRRFEENSDLFHVAVTACNAAQAYHQCGDYPKALDHYLRYLSLTEPRLGSFHLDICAIYHRIGELYHKQQQHSDAKVWYLKALDSFKVVVGPSHPLVAVVLTHLGALHVDEQDYDQALLYHTESLQIKQAHLRWNDPQIAEALASVAQVYSKLGNFSEALLLYDQVHVLQIAIYGADSLQVATTLSSTAQLHYHQHNYDNAFELYQQVLTIQRDHHGEDETTAVANTFSMMGLVLFQKGELDLAKTCFLDSLRISLPILGPDHADIAIIWYNLASIFLKCGDEGTSVTLYSESLRIERLAFNKKDESTYGITVTLQHLAVVCQRSGDYDLASNYISEALQYERSKEKNCTRSIGQLLNLLGNVHLQTGDVTSMMSCFVEASRIFSALGDPTESVAISGLPLYNVSKLHPPSAPVA